MPLYVDVIPTLTVTDETVMDPAALNQLGTPTVHITGTLDGTSTVSIGAGTVENSMLANMEANTVKGRDESTGVPVNLTMHSSMDIASGALKVADGGITTTQLASAATTAAGAIADVNIATGIIGANKLKAQAALTLLGNGGDTASAAPEPILIGTGLTVTNADEIATATRSRVSNEAIITTGSAHSYAAGDKINVTGLGGTGYTAHGVTTLSGTAGSTIKYASVGDDEGSTSDTGGKVRRIENAGVPTSTIASETSPIKAFAFFNAFVTGNLNYTKSGTSVTITLTAHSIETGDIVGIGNTGSSVNFGMFTVTSIPDSNNFTVSDPTNIFSGSSGQCKKRVIVKNSYNISEITTPSAGRISFIFTNSLPNNKYTVTTSSWHGVTLFLAPYTRASMLTSGLTMTTYLAVGGTESGMAEGQYFSMCVMQ